MSKSRPDHYSYTVYADPATARTFDRRRFGGPIGQLIAEEQGRVLANFVGRIKDRQILDVGTGTGRAALFFGLAMINLAVNFHADAVLRLCEKE